MNCEKCSGAGRATCVCPPVVVLGKNGEPMKDALEGVLNDLYKRVCGLQANGQDVASLKDGLGAVQTAVDVMNKAWGAGKPVGGLWRVPFSRTELRHAKATAIHRSVTQCEPVRNQQGVTINWKRNDHPVAMWQDAADLVLIEAHMRGIQSDSARMKRMDSWVDEYEPALKELQAFLKGEGFDTAQSGLGADWIPNEFSQRFFEKMRLEANVFPFFENVSMPRSPYNHPTIAADLIGYLIPETVDDTEPSSTKIGNAAVSGLTAKCTLNAKGIGGFVVYSKYLEEDSVLPVAQTNMRLLPIAAARAYDDAVINGDTAGSHQDSDVTAATDRRKAWDGLRKVALAAAAYKLDASNTAVTTAALWASTIAALRGKLGIHGVHARRVGMICGPKFFNQIINVPEFRTLYAFGAQATALGVDIGTFNPDGMPLMVSEFIREDLNASGVYDGTTTNRGCAILVHQEMWKGGNLRNITLQVLKERFALWDQDAIVATSRVAFAQALTQSASRIHTGILYNTNAA